MKSLSGKTKYFASQKGFTLMELMIVIVLLGILVAAGLSSFMSSQQRGRDNRRKADLRNIASALETFYNDYGRYPSDNGAGAFLACGPSGTSACPYSGCSSDWTAGGATGCSNTYMVKLPTDPQNGRQYYYRKSSNGYQLYSSMENIYDSSYNAGGYAGTNCNSSGSAVCTYGIASSDQSP